MKHLKAFCVLTYISAFLLHADVARAGALACPTAGTVSANATWGPLANADDYYDCSGIDIIVNGGVTLSFAGNTTLNKGVEVRANSFTINGILNANSLGFGATLGPSPGANTASGRGGAGGGHGGKGGGSTPAGGSHYGSFVFPVTLGSGGGHGDCATGGSGGGAIRLVASTSIAVSGTIRADGGAGYYGGCSYSSGGASGGSIWLETPVLTGAGTISANGGAGGSPGNYSAGAGGGRIAIHVTTNSFTGSLSALGGGSEGSQNNGEAGSIALVTGTSISSAGGRTNILSAELASYSNLQFSGGGVYIFTQPVSLAGTLAIGTSGAVTVNMDENVSAQSITIQNGSIVNLKKGVVSNSNLDISGAGSKIKCLSDLVTHTGCGTIQASTMTIGSGALIDANVTGDSATTGIAPGANASAPGAAGGGGHGGAGGSGGSPGVRPGGAAYDSAFQPIQIGSGGGNGDCSYGGTGGGAIRVQISGTLQVDGTISANASNGVMSGCSYSSGGGAGGSVWITTNTLSGTGGTISATGGSGGPTGNYSGGGGGGRIALYYQSKTFSGTVTASGGGSEGSLSNGSSGTVVESSGGSLVIGNGTFTLAQSDLSGISSLVFTTSGTLNFNSVVNFAGALTIGSTGAVTVNFNEVFSAQSISFRNGSIVNVKKGLTATGNMSLADNGTKINCLSDLVNHVGCGTISADNLTVGAGTSINANYEGEAAAAGSGPGGNASGGGAGGGAGHANYGGYGGGSHQVARGVPYGSASAPVTLGSGGGNGDCTLGGRGGGAIKIVVAQNFQLQGTVTANAANGGYAGCSYSSGGGSGGSIWITTSDFSGTTGVISAIGGNGAPSGNYSGGGSGGRVAVYYQTKSYTGTINVAGGSSEGSLNNGSSSPEYVAASGTFVSAVIDFGTSTLTFGTLDYTANTPAGTSVNVEYRAGNTATPDSNWSSWFGVSSGTSLGALGKRYLQYRAILASSGGNKPTLDSITINAPNCYNTGTYYTVQTGAANRLTNANGNTISNFTIVRSEPANTAIRALTSFDGGVTWSKYSSGSWSSVPGGVSTIGTTGSTLAELIAGLNNRTFGVTEATLDFAFGLEADGCGATPALTSVSFDY